MTANNHDQSLTTIILPKYYWLAITFDYHGFDVFLNINSLQRNLTAKLLGVGKSLRSSRFFTNFWSNIPSVPANWSSLSFLYFIISGHLKTSNHISCLSNSILLK